MKSFKPRFLTKRKPKYTSKIDHPSDTINGIIAYNKYGGYCLPKSSITRPACQAILKGKVWEQETLDFIIDHCRGGSIIHAGTYFGDFLPALSKAINENFYVYAFEPNHENYLCAKATKAINGLQNVVLSNFALGESDHHAFLLTKEKGKEKGGASKIIEDKLYGTIEDISVRKFDLFLRYLERIAIIHLDVEGYEEKALKGMIGTIRKYTPILILEDNKNCISGKWFSENIRILGYEPICPLNGNKIFIKS